VAKHLIVCYASLKSILCEQKSKTEAANTKGKKGAKIKMEKNAIGADYDIFLKNNHGGSDEDDGGDGDEFM
jgi:hypothetical protein